MESVGWQGLLWTSWGRFPAGRVACGEPVRSSGLLSCRAAAWNQPLGLKAMRLQGSDVWRLRLQGVELDVRNGFKCSSELSSPDQKCWNIAIFLMEHSFWIKNNFYLSGCGLFCICYCLCPWNFHPVGTFLGLWVICSPGSSVPSSLLVVRLHLLRVIIKIQLLAMDTTAPHCSSGFGQCWRLSCSSRFKFLTFFFLLTLE